MLNVNTVYDEKSIWLTFEIFLGEILRPPRGSVSQSKVFRYKRIMGILYTKNPRNVIVLLDRNITFFRMFRTQYIPDLFLPELWLPKHYLLEV
jgi:hypothetical protein